MTKIVINSKPGGFSLSHHGLMLYAKLKNLNINVYCKSEIDNMYETYIRKIGKENESYLLFLCVLPHEYIFPKKVDANFLAAHTLQISDYFFLIQNNGKKLLNDFRSDPYLVKVIEDINELASGEYASLKVVDIPEDVIWEIWTFDSGSEIVKEVSREWK